MSDIEAIAGDTRQVVTPVFDADRGEQSDLVDVAEIVYVITDEQGQGETLIEKTDDHQDVEITTVGNLEFVGLSDDEDITDNTAVVSVFLRPDETSELPAGTAFHELQLTDTAGNVTTVMQGQVDVTASATN